MGRTVAEPAELGVTITKKRQKIVERYSTQQGLTNFQLQSHSIFENRT